MCRFHFSFSLFFHDVNSARICFFIFCCRNKSAYTFEKRKQNCRFYLPSAIAIDDSVWLVWVLSVLHQRAIINCDTRTPKNRRVDSRRNGATRAKHSFLRWWHWKTHPKIKMKTDLFRWVFFCFNEIYKPSEFSIIHSFIFRLKLCHDVKLKVNSIRQNDVDALSHQITI